MPVVILPPPPPAEPREPHTEPVPVVERVERIERELVYVVSPPAEVPVRKQEPPPVKAEPEPPAPAQPAQTPVNIVPLSFRKAKTEEKTSAPEQESSAAIPATQTGKLAEYNGMGRRHRDEQIDEILDEYLMSGKLPKYVSERQRRDYKRHKRLELRRMYLEQAGIQTIPGTQEDSGDILRLAEAKVQRKIRASGGV